MEITSVLFDPGLGCAAFTVERITCTRSRGGTKSHPVTGQAQQKIASKKAGEVAVTYSSGTSSSSVSVSTDLADLTETDFGMQLLGLIRLYSRSVYVP